MQIQNTQIPGFEATKRQNYPNISARRVQLRFVLTNFVFILLVALQDCLLSLSSR
jgi:hypothetical protein